MVNFRRLTDKAKDTFDKRGGTDALRADAKELRGIARGQGSLKDKAKAAAAAVKDPGQKANARRRDAGSGPASEPKGSGAGPSGASSRGNTPEQPDPTRSK